MDASAADINNEMPTQSSYFNPNNIADASQPESIVTEEPVNTSGPTGYISNEEEDGEDDSANINENDGSQESSDEETDPEQSPKQSAPRERVRYDEGDRQSHFMLGMTFANANEARQAIANYGVALSVKLKINPNEPFRLRVKCINEESCPFVLFISKDGKNLGLAVKTLIPEHRCFRDFLLPSATARFLANYFKDRIYKNPSIKIKQMKDDAESLLKINVSLAKCKRAKRMIIQEMDRSFKVEFGYLEAYAAVLKRSNPGTKAEIELCKEALKEGRRVFKRMFLCFDALKRNWKAGCRPIIGLDGCFLKGVTKGQILTAVGKDGDDQMVPIAWAVIDKENKNMVFALAKART
ncbi:uncharacterized protein LOC125369516 [Ricinus communis]|uniref:uncharacterized protein LOC125369516 n=1 Tax=Ricinus communis TaxID=3988 RepID=UPI00201A5F54|nr:uncharacterized protein LOC125369516 [Ricinus communis]